MNKVRGWFRRLRAKLLVRQVEYFLVEGKREFIVLTYYPIYPTYGTYERSVTRASGGAFAGELLDYRRWGIPVHRYNLAEAEFLDLAELHPALSKDDWINARRELKAKGFEGSRTNPEQARRHLT